MPPAASPLAWRRRRGGCRTASPRVRRGDRRRMSHPSVVGQGLSGGERSGSSTVGKAPRRREGSGSITVLEAPRCRLSRSTTPGDRGDPCCRIRETLAGIRHRGACRPPRPEDRAVPSGQLRPAGGETGQEEQWKQDAEQKGASEHLLRSSPGRPESVPSVRCHFALLAAPKRMAPPGHPPPSPRGVGAIWAGQATLQDPAGLYSSPPAASGQAPMIRVQCAPWRLPGWTLNALP